MVAEKRIVIAGASGFFGLSVARRPSGRIGLNPERSGIGWSPISHGPEAHATDLL